MKKTIMISTVIPLLAVLCGVAFVSGPKAFADELAANEPAASVSDLLPFAGPKYNRVYIKERNTSYGRRYRDYQYQENATLKNAIEQLARSSTESEKQEQWKIIVEELYANSLVPDVISILKRLPEEDRILVVSSCANHPWMMTQDHSPLVPLMNGQLTGKDGIKKMRFELLKTLLLRGDFESAEKLKRLAPRGVVYHGFFEYCVNVPISVFEKYPEVKTMADCYRVLDESWEDVQHWLRKGGYGPNDTRLSMEDLWLFEEKWAYIGMEQALFEDYDLAVESAQKIENDEHRYFILYAIALTMAGYGDMDEVFDLWKKFPPEMFQWDFAGKIQYHQQAMPRPESDEALHSEKHLLGFLLNSQVAGGTKAGPLPADVVLPLMANDIGFSNRVHAYCYANGLIDELCDLIEQSEFFYDGQHHANFGCNPVANLCHYAKTSRLLARKEEADKLMTVAFKVVRGFDDGFDEKLKRKLMYTIAETRHQSELYNHPDSFTREELAFTNPRVGDMEQHVEGSLAWFLLVEEERIMRERELRTMAAGFRYSDDPFFEAAAKTAIEHDNVMALISTGKGLAMTGEAELATVYYRKAIAMSKQVPEWYFVEGLSSVNRDIAIGMIASGSTDTAFFEEVLRTMAKPAEPGKEFLYHSSMNTVASQCIKSQNEALFEKVLGYITDPGSVSSLRREMQNEKNRLAQQALRLAGELPPRPQRNDATSTLPEPESEFDFYAGESESLEGWRCPLALLLKKMPTPEQAREAARRGAVGEEKANVSEYLAARRAVLFKEDESVDDAITRIKNAPSNSINQSKEWQVKNADLSLRSLAYEYLRRGRLDDAMTVMDGMTHQIPKADVLLAVAFRTYDLADTPEKLAGAEKLFERFERQMQAYGNPTADGDNDNGDGRMAPYYRDERYCAYVILLCRRGLTDRAEACLAKINLPFQKAEAVYTVAMKYALTGEFEKSLRLAQTMRDAGTGSYTSWAGEHADGMGPHYSKLQTMTTVLAMAASGKYGGEDFDPLEFVDQIEANDVKVNLLLAVVSGECTTNLIIGRSFLGMPFPQAYDLAGTDDKPRLKDSERAKTLLHRAFELVRDIDDVKLRDKTLLELLPFLVDARMCDDSFEAARLIDTSGDYTTEQRESEYSHSTKIPSHIAAAAALLTEDGHPDEALVLCRKVIDWVKPLKYVGEQGGFWTNRPNDTRNELICRFAEMQAEAGSVEEARKTLAEEHDTIDNQSKKGPYLRRIAEVQVKIGDRDTAKETYVDAVSTVLGDWPDKVFTTPNDQYKYFDAIIDSYCNFANGK